jgi:pyruvate-formate lyase-activating enzyme
MRILAAALAIAAPMVLTHVHAYAQEQDKPLTGPEEMEQKKREAAAEVEKAYKNTLKNTQSGTATTNADPWGNIRSNQTQNPPAKNSK